ncbi:nucleotidyltransferase family protein [Nocardioides daeguensis]|uniref:Nucleotidyltransferase family protein n=1 Tax=Nocardioides daeguensis TaxID=908359 RepID=A0ABP6W4G9_9ACTN|nr:nucleotidyltransferase family protein [Nocardioides daeguensis]
MTATGLLLAAGAGTRMGLPKALVRGDDGPWLTRSVQVLLDGGCAQVVVVLGAGADEAAPLLDGLPRVTAVRSQDWSSGMGASLATGLAALDTAPVDAALVHLVDLPDVTAAVVARVLAAGHGPTTLSRASYDGTPGHPVLLGRGHWAGVAESAVGDRGARAYLAAHDVALVECGDLATGADVDGR